MFTDKNENQVLSEKVKNFIDKIDLPINCENSLINNCYKIINVLNVENYILYGLDVRINRRAGWGTQIKCSFKRDLNDIKLQEVVMYIEDYGTFEMGVSITFFYDFAKQIQICLDNYSDWLKCVNIVNETNKRMLEILNNIECLFTIEWIVDSGNRVVYIDDKHIQIGITFETLQNATGLIEKYDTDKIFQKQFEDTLKICVTPMDLIKINNVIRDSFVVFSDQKLRSILKQVCNRNLLTLHTGMGYYITENYYTIVKVVAVSEEALSINRTGVVVCDNKKPTIQEKKDNKTKLIYEFLVKPKGWYNQPYTITLEDILSECNKL